jgi:hypothetical protein
VPKRPLWYNFARINSAIRMSPAMDIVDIVKLIEEWEADNGQEQSSGA